MSNKNKKTNTKLTMDDVEQAVRFWEKLGFNVLPFNTHVKIPNVPEWQKFIPPNHIPAENIDEWIKMEPLTKALLLCLVKYSMILLMPMLSHCMELELIVIINRL